MNSKPSIAGEIKRRPLLDELVKRSSSSRMSAAERQEQTVSFVYGNAPDDSKITKNEARALLRELSPR